MQTRCFKPRLCNAIPELTTAEMEAEALATRTFLRVGVREGALSQAAPNPPIAPGCTMGAANI